MKTIKIIIVFSFVFFWGIQIANSQNLTYNEFFQLSKKDRWSDIERFMSSKNYKYAGSIDRKDHRTIAWTFNCLEFSFNEKGIYYEFGPHRNCSVIYIQEYNDKYRTYTYVFLSNETYNLFLKTAKNYGFIFSDDGYKEDEIYEIYKRNNEWLTFSKNKTGSFRIVYEP